MRTPPGQKDAVYGWALTTRWSGKDAPAPLSAAASAAEFQKTVLVPLDVVDHKLALGFCRDHRHGQDLENGIHL